MAACTKENGEIMLRLKAPGQERLLPTPCAGGNLRRGGEANVAVSLVNYGTEASFFTALPKGAIGDACIRERRRFNVDTSRILRAPGRMGIYYLEGGANQLPSRVIYDRENTAIAQAAPGSIDWENTLADVDWFHIMGITPAISETAMLLSLEARYNGIL